MFDNIGDKARRRCQQGKGGDLNRNTLLSKKSTTPPEIAATSQKSMKPQINEKGVVTIENESQEKARERR